jgi:hypothetical protein
MATMTVAYLSPRKIVGVTASVGEGAEVQVDDLWVV